MNIDAIFEVIKEKETDKFSDLYEVLGCNMRSTQEQINTEYKKRALAHHPDRNPEGEIEFTRLNRAYEVLGDPQNREKYDAWKCSGIQIPYLKWSTLSEHGQSLHWKNSPIVNTITNGEPEYKESSGSNKSTYGDESDDIYSKFRNYQI